MSGNCALHGDCPGYSGRRGRKSRHNAVAGMFHLAAFLRFDRATDCVVVSAHGFLSSRITEFLRHRGGPDNVREYKRNEGRYCWALIWQVPFGQESIEAWHDGAVPAHVLSHGLAAGLNHTGVAWVFSMRGKFDTERCCAGGVGARRN